MILRLVVLACVVAGCRGASDSQPAPAPEPAPEPTPTAPPTPPPASEDGPAFEWPETIPQPAGAELTRPASAGLDAIGYELMTPFAQAWAEWRPQLLAAGVELRELVETPGSLSATLCSSPGSAKAGGTAPCERRYALTLMSYGEQAARGWLSPALAREPIALAGECLPIPTTSFAIIEHRSGHGYDHYYGMQIDVEQDYHWTFGPRRELDLDRDGTIDAMVPTRPPERTCPRRVEGDLWVRRGDCAHLVGHIEGDPAAVWRPPPVELAAGMIVLPTRREPQSPAESPIDLVYTFDGTSYRTTERTELTARCDVHPADCDPMIRSSCRLE